MSTQFNLSTRSLSTLGSASSAHKETHTAEYVTVDKFNRALQTQHENIKNLKKAIEILTAEVKKLSEHRS